MFSIVMALSLAFPSEEPTYRWQSTPTDPGRLYLYRDGVQIGGYDLAEHFYRSYDGKDWGPRTEPPLPPPCFGVALAKIGGQPIYRLNGQPVPARAAYEAVDKGFDDDSGKFRVTLIGPAEVRAKAREALENHPDFTSLKPRVIVRDFAPDHWAMNAGFVTTGQPTIYCQAPGGKVLHRQDDFAGGPAALIAAIRHASDRYDSSRDPDLRPRASSLVGTLAAVLAVIAAGVALVRARRS